MYMHVTGLSLVVDLQFYCIFVHTCRFRLIPGDHCVATEESKKLVATVNKPCTGHEKQSGIHPVTVSTMVSIYVHAHCMHACAC